MMTATNPLRWLLAFAYATMLHGVTIDSDFDGVADRYDACPDTPFLAEVDAKGCVTKLLYFPQERRSGNIDLLIGYEYNFNEEDINYDIQHSLTLKLNYVQNDWIFVLRTGKFIQAESNQGMRDTVLTVRKRFHALPNWRYTLSASVRLPTYDFPGNKTDVSLRFSTVYYPKLSWSVFGGVGYTFIGDRMIDVPLRNTRSAYVGTGYFVTKTLYLNTSYNYITSKYVTTHPIQTISGTFFYEMSKDWYTTLTYAHQINDDDRHYTFIWMVGYRIR